MTYLYAAYPEFKATQEVVTQMPDPRSPEEVLRMLSQNPPPEGEYSADAF
ncbi:hypothetical protein [Comamonas guangdongensis]|uniref:Uncharacterized protein n=1 Tax=Comamonas guangdongensis TaxID=510515 RepID=A0ABV3ZT50_9BURK